MASSAHLPRIRRAQLPAALSALLLLALVGGLLTPATVQAAPADRIALQRLTTVLPAATTPPDGVRFEALLNYQLASNPNGFVLIFAFENNSDKASNATPLSLPLKGGAGQLKLDFDYRPKPDTQTLSLMFGLFKDKSTLLTWVTTDPSPINPWLARSAFDQGMAAHGAGNYSAALDPLSRAVQLAPDNGNYVFWLADTQNRLGEYPEAIATYSQALQLTPGDPATLVGRGVAEVWDGDFDSAISDLSPIADAGTPTSRWTATAHRARGLAFAAVGQPDQAIADYQAYLTLRPNASDRDQVEGWISALTG